MTATTVTTASTATTEIEVTEARGCRSVAQELISLGLGDFTGIEGSLHGRFIRCLCRGIQAFDIQVALNSATGGHQVDLFLGDVPIF